MKAVLFKGASQYGVLRHVIDEIAGGFAARGFEPAILDLAAHNSDKDIQDFLDAHRPAHLAFSIMVLGDHRGPGGHSIGETLHAPHVVLYVDYPLTQGERLLDTAPDAALLTVDPSHIEAVRGVLPGHFAHLGFCPHGGCGEPAMLPDTAEAFAAARPIRMLFAGGNVDALGDPPWAHFPDDFKPIYADAAEIALAEEWLAPHLALERAFAAHGIAIDEVYDPAGRQVVRMLAAHVNEWVRRIRRHRFLDAAARLKLPLTAYGVGFDAPSPFDARGAADFSELRAAMGRARLAVNVNANFGRGGHERPLTAMLAGAAVASDTSAFYREAFAPDEIVLFRWQHLDDDLRRLRDLADDPKALFEIARAGQAKAASQHRWANRIDTILAAADAARVKSP